MHINISLAHDEVDSWLRHLEESLSGQIDAAVKLISDTVAAEAKANHSYQNRTGNLEESTIALDVVGDFYAGTLRGEVVAIEDYASYVDDMPSFAFLMPAWEATAGQHDKILEDAVQQAVNLAG